MKLQHTAQRALHAQRRGAALLLSLLVLLVLVAIVIEISASTLTDARIARNDIGITSMDLAAESCLLDVYDRLKVDGQSGGGGAADPAGGGGAPTGEGASGAAAPGAPGATSGATDSRRDEWATPRREEINEIRMRILVQDEDSKVNVLAMLSPNEEDAQAAFDRVVRCLDLCRDGTAADIDSHTADAMAKAMLEFMKHRTSSKVPRSQHLTDDEKDEDVYLPLSLKEFAVLPPFDEGHFRDFRDENGVPVHSIGSFLTVWSSLSTLGAGAQSTTEAASAGSVQPPPPVSGGAQGNGSNGGSNRTGGSSDAAKAGDGTSAGADSTGTAGGAGTPGAAGGGAGAAEASGYAVNVNTAPTAVLKCLLDDRVAPPRFWDKVIEYRNLEEEKKKGEEDEEEEQPAVDEYGEEIIQRRIFDSLTELSEVDGFTQLDPDVQRQIKELVTTQSHVFSIYVIAHRTTSSEGETDELARGRRGKRDAESDHADALVRVIRSVVWRRDVGGEVSIVPIVRWEVLDYIPMEVLDYPDDDR